MIHIIRKTSNSKIITSLHRHEFQIEQLDHQNQNIKKFYYIFFLNFAQCCWHGNLIYKLDLEQVYFTLRIGRFNGYDVESYIRMFMHIFICK